MPECMITHTDYDPPFEGFYCPKCGQKHGRKFGISDGGGVGQYGCSKLHLWDHMDCSHCGWNGYGDEWVKLMGKEHQEDRKDDSEGTLWMVEYASRQIGPFTLSVRKQTDGGFTWTIGWKTSSAALAGGKSPTYAEAQEEAENAVEGWLDDAQEQL